MIILLDSRELFLYQQVSYAKGLLTDIGTEELAHWEIVATMIYKLVKGVPAMQLREAGLGAHFAQHDRAVYPADAAGVPWTAAYIQATGDPIADLHEDLAADGAPSKEQH